MKVSNVVKVDGDIYKFSGEISESEHDLVMSVGLNLIYTQGLMEMISGVSVDTVDETEVEVFDEHDAPQGVQ